MVLTFTYSSSMQWLKSSELWSFQVALTATSRRQSVQPTKSLNDKRSSLSTAVCLFLQRLNSLLLSNLLHITCNKLQGNCNYVMDFVASYSFVQHSIVVKHVKQKVPRSMFTFGLNLVYFVTFWHVMQWGHPCPIMLYDLHLWYIDCRAFETWIGR